MSKPSTYKILTVDNIMRADVERLSHRGPHSAALARAILVCLGKAQPLDCYEQTEARRLVIDTLNADQRGQAVETILPAGPADVSTGGKR